jgi:hypothetical protein
MGRIKRDHSGYRTHGIFVKYQQPSIVETQTKLKSKKNTTKWCRGKVGVEHDLVQWAHTFGGDNYKFTYFTTKCRNCRKQVSKKRVKSLPLILPVRYTPMVYVIQVKSNGKAVPIDSRLFTGWWCSGCQEYHPYD